METNDQAGLSPNEVAKKKKSISVVKATEEELLQKIADLEKKLQSQESMNLDDKIRFYEIKKQRINDLTLFQDIRKLLTGSLGEVNPVVENEEFETKQYKLILTTHREYGDGTKLFSISNPLIIQQCMNFIITAIEGKISDLEKEIQL